jgi:hypothetical protein
MARDVTADAPPRHSSPGRHKLRWWMPLIVVAVGAWLIATRALFVDAAHVSRLTVVNPTAYDIDVEITGGDRNGWHSIGTAKSRASTAFEEIPDQGQTWVVRLADGEAGELRISRTLLERAGWRIEIPRPVEDRLRTAWGPPELLAD